MTPTLTVTGTKEARAALQNVTDNLKKQMGIVAWKAATKGKSLIAKDITQELAVPQKVVREQVNANRVGGRDAEVVLKKSRRISLREFGARQNKTGVSYRISKTQGRKTVAGAFQGPRPGVMKSSWKGNVFKRVGKKRLPIRKLRGVSPWGSFVKRNRIKPVGAQIQAELRKQLNERVRYLTLKKQGVI